MKTLTPASTSQTLQLERQLPTRPTDRLAMRIALWLLLWSTRPTHAHRDDARLERFLRRQSADRFAQAQRAHVSAYTATLPNLR